MNDVSSTSKINSKTYFKEIFPKQEFAKHKPNVLVKALLLHRAHPTLMKVSIVFALALGVALLATMPMTQHLLSSCLPSTSWVTPTLSTLGSVDIAVCLVALGALGIFGLMGVPPYHPMSQHVFRSKSVKNPQLDGKLEYKGDIPILTINNADDYFYAGKTYGYLCAQETAPLISRTRFLLFKLGFLSGEGLPPPNKATRVIEGIKGQLPERYLEEMEGFVEGHNQWCIENGKYKNHITVEELILIHLLPEKMHFNVKYVEEVLKMNEELKLSEPPSKPTNPPGCSTILARDQDESILFKRNLEWQTDPHAAKHFIVLKRVYKDKTLVDLSLLGLLGPLTAMNSKGFCLAMNVTDPIENSTDWTNTIDGIPALWFNRLVAEKDSVETAKAFLNSGVNQPLGPYHITIADKNEGTSYHLFQGQHKNANPLKKRKHYFRDLGKNDDYLSTTNRYYKDGLLVQEQDLMNSDERECRIQTLHDHAKNTINDGEMETAEFLNKASCLPYVTNNLSIQSFLMKPKEKSIEIHAANTGFGALGPYTNLNKIYDSKPYVLSEQDLFG